MATSSNSVVGVLATLVVIFAVVFVAGKAWKKS